MTRTFEDARRWSRVGTALLVDAAEHAVGALDAPSGLPGWTRGHVVAHVAANADALGNLVRWAASGEPSPMYASPDERAEGIARGGRLPAVEVMAWLRRSAEELDAAMAGLDDARWNAPVVTAHGRTVPATELPWMRAREVCVHAVDLATGVSFADLPADFLAALCADVVGRRSATPGPALVLTATDTGGRWTLPGEDEPVAVEGPLHEITAYLTGRPGPLTEPALAAWL